MRRRAGVRPSAKIRLLEVLAVITLRAVLAGGLHRLDVSLTEQEEVLVSELDLQAGLGKEQHTIPLANAANVRADERDLGPLASARGRRSRGRDEQAAPGSSLPAARLAHDETVAGEADLLVEHGPSPALGSGGLRRRLAGRGSLRAGRRAGVRAQFAGHGLSV